MDQRRGGHHGSTGGLPIAVWPAVLQVAGSQYHDKDPTGEEGGEDPRFDPVGGWSGGGGALGEGEGGEVIVLGEVSKLDGAVVKKKKTQVRWCNYFGW
jgi:hypothetical protein